MANSKNISYVRVSILEQNEARQRETLQPYNIDKWYRESIRQGHPTSEASGDAGIHP